MSDSLPTDFIIAAQIRVAAKQGVPIVVRRRGDSHSGSITLKINLLDGTARVLTQVRFNDELVWSPISDQDPMDDEAAEAYLSRQEGIDPDSWVLEIEDRQGRLWFSGRVVKI